MNPRIHGKNVVITGASSGIGEQMAIKAAESGANLVLLARRVEKLEELKSFLESRYSNKVWIHSLDVSERENVEAVFSAIFAEAGKIDVLVNNAGFGIFEEAHLAKWGDIERMFAVNVLGLISCTQMVIEHMQKNRSGHIVNIASQAGKIATPKSSIYAATKHAVLGFSNSLRMELSTYGVFVTTVNPGPIATNFFEIADRSGTYVQNIQRFMLKPEKVAEKVVAAMLTNTREINLPRWMNAGSVFYTLFPRLVEKVGKNAFFKK
ncbi:MULTISPECIES: SDR family NAD(P)-dependent oxidoreductase [Bacillus]|uniref:Oxidoreductase n=1 Tax=Bacillus smithii 7_3_47FAA TaxID=665952 RepID=G9QPF4_9BACI|nr:SDR family oxidoreductase [Bacillus smithii]EHL73816.1 hypothetical protein HMPREF1015_00171 [Bacillus smithii 7_3_47FAA]MED1487876.1 SDR family oxidoreductase [Bacillus smithii]